MFVEHKEQGESAKPTLKFSRLSAAIREGCKITTETRHGCLQGGTACAIGAAAAAFGHGYSADIGGEEGVAGARS